MLTMLAKIVEELLANALCNMEEYLWVCMTCSLGVFRSYIDIATDGNPICRQCGIEMHLTPAAGRRMKEVLSKLSGTILV